jgi:serine phosphatase RsbU (regulator of sigma subunit)
MNVDHSRDFNSTLVCASPHAGAPANAITSWRADAHRAEIELRPSDIVIAASDGFFDAVHVSGTAGLEARRDIRQAYLNDQLDPGQLAEKLLLRAWNAVQRCRELPPAQIRTPFFEEARRVGRQERFRQMPEDDIAVVVSYVLQA